MRFSSALVVATSLFLSTSAFLITPEIAEAASEATESWKDLIFNRPRTLDLACHECPFVVDEKTAAGLKSVARLATLGENTIHLEFVTENGELKVNNASVYPLARVGEPFPRVFAHQNRVDNGEAGIDVPTDYAFSVEGAVKPGPRFHRGKFGRMNPEDDAELLLVDFTVMSLAGQPVQAQTAHLELIRDQDGALTIVRIEGADFDNSQNDACATASNPSVCRLRAMITDRLSRMIEEARARAASMRSWMKTDAPAPGNKAPKKPCSGSGRGKFGKDHPHGGPPSKGPDGRPHRGPPGEGPRGSHGPHGPHHGHHSRGHKISQVINHVLRNFVVPAMFGIAGGLAASALGIMVGQSIVYLWCRFGRGGRRGQVENVRIHEVEIADGEKEGLMAAAEEDLPRYEEAPRYTDVQAQTTP